MIHTQNNTQKIVLTGGPGIGKTTLINILANRGYSIVPESARIVIENAQKENSDCLPWLNCSKFQEVVSRTQLNLEDSINSEIAFLDRGIVDSHAYSKLNGITTPYLVYKVGRDRYSKVFILDQLEIYQTDSARKEDKETAKKIHLAIREAYIEFGYNPIYVPVLPPEERTDFIISRLKEAKK